MTVYYVSRYQQLQLLCCNARNFINIRHLSTSVHAHLVDALVPCDPNIPRANGTHKMRATFTGDAAACDVQMWRV